MNFQSTEFAFVLILVVLIVQAFALAIVLFRLNRQVRDLDKGLDGLNGKLSSAMKIVQSVLDGALPIVRSVPRLRDEFQHISSRVLESVRESDRFIADTVARLRNGTREVEQKLDSGVRTFSQYSHQVHEGIIHPTKRISLAFDALSSLLNRYFSRRPPSPEFVAEDEQFI